MSRSKDGLRSTPRRFGGHDAVVFPEADAAYRAQGTPHWFALRVTPTRVRITFDYLIVPDEMEARVAALYEDYVTQWAAEWPHFPRHGLAYGSFYDYCQVTVLRAHAAWWIKLFREASTVCYESRFRRRSSPAEVPVP